MSNNRSEINRIRMNLMEKESNNKYVHGTI